MTSVGKKKCSIDGCDREHRGLGFCNKHYQSFKTYGNPYAAISKVSTEGKTCSIVSCTNKVYAKNLCNKHYIRNKKYGDPLCLKVKEYNRLEASQYIENLSINEDNCIDWPFYLHKNYSYVGGKAAYVLVCKLYNGDAPSEDHEVAHTCGNSKCVNPKHLRWATKSENQMDRVLHGTSNRGSKHGMSKLKEEEVLNIKKLLMTDIQQKEIAEIYGVGKTTIHHIKSGATWNWLNKDV